MSSELNELCNTLDLPPLICRPGPMKFCEMSTVSENANNLHRALKVREIHFPSAGRFRWRRHSWRKRKQIDTEKVKIKSVDVVNQTSTFSTAWVHMPTHVLHLLGKVTVSEPQSTPLTQIRVGRLGGFPI